MKSHLPFYLFLFVVTVFKLFFTGLFKLAPDEAYYWFWTENLSLSYHDHPPMVAWFIALPEFLFGHSERATRLMAVISGSVIMWVSYIMASDIFSSRKAGFLSAFLFLAIPVTGLGGMIITPDTPLILFWALALYFGYRIVDTQNGNYFYAMGAMFGLAMLSKYNAALFAPAFLLFLLVSTENRRWLFRKEPYLAFLLSIAIFSPVIIWNIQHDFASFGFQFSHAFDAKKAEPFRFFSQFWLGQLGIYGGLLFFFLIAGAIGAYKLAIEEKRDDYLYLFMMSAPLFLFFLVNSFRAWMEANWSVMAYISAIIALPGVIQWFKERSQSKWGAITQRGFYLSILLSFAATAYVHVYIAVPTLPMPDAGEINRKVYGWDTLSEETDKRLAQMKGDTFISASRYQIASILRYYTKDHRDAFTITGIGRFGYFSSDEELIGKDSLYVTEMKRLDLDRVKESFEDVKPVGTWSMERNGVIVRRFAFFECYNYKGGLLKFRESENSDGKGA